MFISVLLNAASVLIFFKHIAFNKICLNFMGVNNDDQKAMNSTFHKANMRLKVG